MTGDTPSTGQCDWQLVIAARAALDAHGVLEATHDTEPSPRSDEAAWTRWQNEVHLPAHHAWQETIACLKILLGQEFPGREGAGWVTFCLRILTAESNPQREEGEADKQQISCPADRLSERNRS